MNVEEGDGGVMYIIKLQSQNKRNKLKVNKFNKRILIF